jgi:hypothetical protein
MSSADDEADVYSGCVARSDSCGARVVPAFSAEEKELTELVFLDDSLDEEADNPRLWYHACGTSYKTVGPGWMRAWTLTKKGEYRVVRRDAVIQVYGVSTLKLMPGLERRNAQGVWIEQRCFDCECAPCQVGAHVTLGWPRATSVEHIVPTCWSCNRRGAVACGREGFQRLGCVVKGSDAPEPAKKVINADFMMRRMKEMKKIAKAAAAKARSDRK